ncbi:hypothetical protein VB005_02453 [Metarhizium brunneum]
MYPPPPNWLPRQRALRRPAIVTQKARWTSGHLTVVRIACYQRCRVDDKIMVASWSLVGLQTPCDEDLFAEVIARAFQCRFVHQFNERELSLFTSISDSYAETLVSLIMDGLLAEAS